MIVAQLSVAPIGEGTGLHKFVKAAVEEIKKSGVKFEINAMATVMETTDLDTLFDVVKEAHNAVLRMGAKRVITEIKIDDRRDKEATMKSKVTAVKE